jgi:hypothetical protein
MTETGHKVNQNCLPDPIPEGNVRASPQVLHGTTATQVDAATTTRSSD